MLITARRAAEHAYATPSHPGLGIFDPPVFPASPSRLFCVPNPRVSCFALQRDRSGTLPPSRSPTPPKPGSIAVPALLSILSGHILLIHFISTRKFVKKLFKVEDKEEFEPVEQVPRGFIAKLHHHADRYGGTTIFIYRVLRLLAVLSLVGLATASLVLGGGLVHISHRPIRLSWSLLGAYVRISSLVDCK